VNKGEKIFLGEICVEEKNRKKKKEKNKKRKRGKMRGKENGKRKGKEKEKENVWLNPDSIKYRRNKKKYTKNKVI